MARRKSGSSIIFRLGVERFLERLSLFLALDLLLCVLFAGAGLWVVETRAAGILADAQSAEWTGAVELGGWSVQKRSAADGAQPPPEWLQGLLPEESEQAGRRLSWGVSPSLAQRLRGARYTLTLDTGETGRERYIVLTAEIGPVLWAAWVCLVIILCWQGLSLLGACIGASRTYSRILRPLWELTETTRALSAGEKLTPEELQKLSSALDSITAGHLDARIPTAKLNAELRPLAQAVNQMLERVDDAYRSQMRFVSDASHELRTPIAVIQGYADLLSRWGTEDPATMRESITAIRSEAAAMKEMVEQLLFLARGDNDSMHLELENVSLAAIASEVQREIEMIDQTHVFVSDLVGDGIVYADAGLMKQLLRVLVDNSVKYTPAGGRVTLTLRQEENTVRLSVQDEGCGIAPDELPRVFDRFYRADRSRTRDTGGSGLGLSIAKWIVEKHGGWFEVTSSVGIGTRMTVCLPAAPKESAADSESA
ncbi:MAG TPA: HAMP domain-containing protein [Candidatus Ventrousia excrementavium]|uniref:histidine kinase n=1 Tax=Candidatus Ventrousia excrementavium TaxID=2840961 RepID=A0A9D1ITX6_9CLOT|nr:HAMP domain-containing protein [Candidatus Ventrousia excrementavium]